MNKLPERIRIKDIARLAGVSVGTVDRVIHRRSGVSPKSKQKVEEILKELNYQPNMYASALASNKRYAFSCILPLHAQNEYWTDIETGIHNALKAYSDFNISIEIKYYDPYRYPSFTETCKTAVAKKPDGMLLAPTLYEYTKEIVELLNEQSIPYIYIDSNIQELPALAFYGQNSRRSGYFAASMLMLLAQKEATEIVIFRKIHKGVIGSNQQENREIGFRNYMQEHYPHCSILELDLYAERNDEDACMLDNFFQAHPNVRNGITFNSKAYIIGEYMQQLQRKDFNMIGYDLLPRNVACLKQGYIHFLIAQKPELQGFYGIKALCDFLIFKKEVNRINYMPIDLLTAETIEYYSLKSDDIQD